jgi:hypothetical protein
VRPQDGGAGCAGGVAGAILIATQHARCAHARDALVARPARALRHVCQACSRCERLRPRARRAGLRRAVVVVVGAAGLEVRSG